MVIQQKYAAIAVKYTDERRKNLGVVFDDDYLEDYKGRLQKIAEESGMKEGRELDFSDWSMVYRDVVYLMMDATARVRRKDDEYRSQVKPNEYIFSALNYLIALTSEVLGSPNLPIENFRGSFRPWAQTIISAKPTTNISLEDTYNQQRKIDAMDLQRDRIQPLLDQIYAKNNIPENIGKLYAEYQALVRRQAGHGFFWRIFHSAENAERTALINDLAETLKQYAPNLDLTAKTPVSANKAAKTAEEEQTVRGMEAGVRLFDRDIATTFGYRDEMLKQNLKQVPTEKSHIEKNNIIAHDSDSVA